MPHNNTSASSFHISCSWQSHNDVQKLRTIQSMKTDINQFNIYFYLFILASKKLHGGHTKRTPHRVCRVMPWTGVAFWPLTRITPIIASSLHLLVGERVNILSLRLISQQYQQHIISTLQAGGVSQCDGLGEVLLGNLGSCTHVDVTRPHH